MRKRMVFAERFPDQERKGSSSNLITGELIEARRRIPSFVDLRDSERTHWWLMHHGLEPVPRRAGSEVLRAHFTEYWAGYVVGGGVVAWVGGMFAAMGVEVWWWPVLLFYMLVGGTLFGA